MLLAYGFLRKVFEIFEKYRTPIDMITTSEVAVSVTIDELSSLDDIVSELRTLGLVEVDSNQSIICIVGNSIAEDEGTLKSVLDALKGIPVRMLSYGGSRHNVSVLVDSQVKKEALSQLNEGVFIW